MYFLLFITQLWSQKLNSEFINQQFLSPQKKFFQEHAICSQEVDEIVDYMESIPKNEITKDVFDMIDQRLQRIEHTKAPGCVLLKVMLHEIRYRRNDKRAFECENLMNDHFYRRSLTKDRELPICIDYIMELYLKGKKK